MQVFETFLQHMQNKNQPYFYCQWVFYNLAIQFLKHDDWDEQVYHAKEC